MTLPQDLLVQSRNVAWCAKRKCHSNPAAAVRWECAKSPFYGDFQGLWEARETAFCFPRFPSDRHFHRFRAPAIFSTIVNESYQRDVTRHEAVDWGRNLVVGQLGGVAIPLAPYLSP
jgi:hypothetical protein